MQIAFKMHVISEMCIKLSKSQQQFLDCLDAFAIFQ